MKNYVGIDIGGTGIKAALISEEGETLAKSVIQTLATRDYTCIVADMAQQVKELVGDSAYEAIGIGCPGAIDSARGVIEYSNNLYWKNVPLVGELKKHINKPICVSNDANVAALGEAKFGASREFADSVMLTLGTGVGGGIIIGGKLYEGYKSMGAELGHMVIVAGGVQCTCGRRGCLEAYASATALIRETIFAMMVDRNSKMWEFVGGDLNNVDGRASFECAKAGDKTAQGVVDAYIDKLADGIVNVVNIFRSEAIILGGGVSAQGDYLVKPLSELVDARRYGGENSLKTIIRVAKLGNDAGILGAASLVM